MKTMRTISALLIVFAIGCGTTDKMPPPATTPITQAATPKESDALFRDKDVKEAKEKVVAEIGEGWAAIRREAAEKPSWSDQVKGVSKEALSVCADSQRWKVANYLYILVVGQPDAAQVAVVDIGKVKDYLVKATKSYLASLVSFIGKAVPCRSTGEGTRDMPLTGPDVEQVIEGMDKAAITPEDVGMTVIQLRDLHLRYVKLGLPDILKSFRHGNSDASGNLWGYLYDWHYTPAELGLTKAEAEKILSGSSLEGGGDSEKK